MSRTRLDPRRWFDRMQPQTLQIATWLLYLNGFFALVGLLDRSVWIGYARVSKGALELLVGLVIVAAHVLSGFFMANDRRLGYRLGLVAAFSPFALHFWVLAGSASWNTLDKVTGRNTISFLFEVALCALLLHPHSREHQRLWYR